MSKFTFLARKTLFSDSILLYQLFIVIKALGTSLQASTASIAISTPSSPSSFLLVNKLRFEADGLADDAPEMHHVEGAFLEMLLKFT
uniref:Uncharacterized protein n=1 Tax=Cucumis melo TaxID=3656 RepID=A0A9I9EHU0_CUCME